MPGRKYDTREMALAQHSLVPVSRIEGEIKLGLWVCPATAKVITDPSEIDVDHVVALWEAHRTGGQNWSPELREDFANALGNVMCVSRSWNRSKAGHSPYRRMPPNVAWWEWYLNQRDLVKSAYNLGDLPGERRHAEYFRIKQKYHSKGINVGRVRAALTPYIPWLASL